ncbi:hypothetical protein [Methylophaga muralis]|uniref:Uncharacterized protein n=1 Tax=Methylophaga muralis TaxID=291169 RepID=A0A1E3GQ31_9GAMM|nr:hypothetical protein [Methylophaga muralis]ODN66149.1 hypothetical protein A9E74_02098 [Methylophaga muralis]
MISLKKALLIGGSLLLVVVLSLMIHNAWAGGKSVISLNSPVSFPVDI